MFFRSESTKHLTRNCVMFVWLKFSNKCNIYILFSCFRKMHKLLRKNHSKTKDVAIAILWLYWAILLNRPRLLRFDSNLSTVLYFGFSFAFCFLIECNIELCFIQNSPMYSQSKWDKLEVNESIIKIRLSSVSMNSRGLFEKFDPAPVACLLLYSSLHDRWESACHEIINRSTHQNDVKILFIARYLECTWRHCC